MGKRGPKASGPPMTFLSTRIQVATRDALERAAAERKPKSFTLAREVETRLRRSFDEDRKLADIFGGQELYGILRLAGAALTAAGEVAFSSRTGRRRPAKEWLSDPYAYEQALNALMAVMEAFRPVGDPAPPGAAAVLKAHAKNPSSRADAAKLDWALGRIGLYAAAQETMLVAEADPEPPLPGSRASEPEKRASRIAARLGERMHARLKENMK